MTDENLVMMSEPPRRIREREASPKQDEPNGDEPEGIEAFIASLTEPDDAWKVTVYRMMEAGRTDSAARREFCCTLPVTEDLQETIRDTYGSGTYSLDFRQGGKIRKKGVISIADLPDNDDDDDELDEPGYAPPAAVRDEETEQRLGRIEATVASVARALETIAARDAAPPVQPAQSNPLNLLRESMRTVRELQELDADLRPPSNQQPASTQSDEDRAWAALLKNPELRGKIASSMAVVMGNGDAPEPVPWYAQVAVEIAKQPALTNRALGFLDRVLPGGAAATTAQAAQASGVVRQTEPAQPVARANVARTTEVETVADDKLDIAEVLGNVVVDLKNNSDVDDSVNDCVALMDDAEVGAMLTQLLQQSATDVLASLRLYFPAVAPMIAVEHAEEWVNDLKAGIERRLEQQSVTNAIRATLTKPVDA